MRLMNNNKTSIRVNLSHDLKARIAKIAESEGRSVSQQTEIFLARSALQKDASESNAFQGIDEKGSNEG